jgi:hypothetical protein
MDSNLYYLLGAGGLLFFPLIFLVIRGNILSKGAVIYTPWLNQRELVVVGIVVLFIVGAIGFMLSPYSSVPIIMGLGFLVSIIIRLVRGKGDTRQF